MRAILIAAALGFAPPAFAQAPADPSAATPTGETWELDQLRVARDVPEAKLKALEADHSLDAVIKTLTGLGIAFKRGHVRIPADQLAPDLRSWILTLPPGEPFVVPDPDFWSISVIVSRSLPPGSVRFLPSPSFAPSRKA